MSAVKKTDPFLFIVVSMWVFACSLFLLNSVNFVPYYVTGDAPTLSDSAPREYLQQPKQPPERIPQPPTPPPSAGQLLNPGQPNLPSATTEAPDLAFLPERIYIPGLNKALPIVNPVKDDVATLDRELLDAVVRFPGSGLLNEDGNIFIFGHSSHLRTVNNPMFKAFNGIEALPKGSLIQVIGGGRVYVYQVTKQQKVSATSALVDLTPVPGQRLLTLSTCDSFGAKTDRFVVTAEFSVSYIDTKR